MDDSSLCAAPICRPLLMSSFQGTIRPLVVSRLLQYNVSVADKVVNPPKQAVSVFVDTQSSEIKDRIFDEFNSLAVVYHKPSYMFTDKEYRGPFAFSDIISVQMVDANDKDLLLSTSEKEESRGHNNNGSAYNASAYDNSLAQLSASQTQSELVSIDQTPPAHGPQTSSAIDDLLGLGFSVGPTAPSPPPLNLSPKAVLDPNTFQQK